MKYSLLENAKSKVNHMQQVRKTVDLSSGGEDKAAIKKRLGS
jgi:hypothetical protein